MGVRGWRYPGLNCCSESFPDPVAACFAAGSPRRQGFPEKASIRNVMRQYIAGDEKERSTTPYQ